MKKPATGNRQPAMKAEVAVVVTVLGAERREAERRLAAVGGRLREVIEK